MLIRSDWSLAREGVTADTFGRFLELTALNPIVTLPLLLAAKYTAQGNFLEQHYGAAFQHLKTLFALGLLLKGNSWLNSAVLNNWSNDAFDWNKEVVVVTGGSDGIGKIVVQLLAEKGIKVAVIDVQELTYEAPPSVRLFRCDLSSPSAIASTAASIHAAMGNPTVLIMNAGVARGKPILATTEKDLNLTFKVNTFSHYYLTQQFLPSMIENNHGIVCTVASTAGYVAAPAMVDYSSSKSAAVSFHEGLTAELVTHYKAPKVRTILMCQGYTRTALFEGFDSKFLYPETVAESIVKAVLEGKSRHILLPEFAWLILPRIRSLPLWMQYGIRKRLGDLMKGWKGRQVAQPSEVKGEESKVLVGKEVGERAVLVNESVSRQAC